MTENDIQKCLLSYGFFPMTLILKELEENEFFEECLLILNSMNNYRERFKIVEECIPTKYSKEFEKEYYSYFKKIDDNGVLLAKENIKYYLKEIKIKLNLKSLKLCHGLTKMQ